MDEVWGYFRTKPVWYIWLPLSIRQLWLLECGLSPVWPIVWCMIGTGNHKWMWRVGIRCSQEWGASCSRDMMRGCACVSAWEQRLEEVERELFRNNRRQNCRSSRLWNVRNKFIFQVACLSIIVQTYVLTFFRVFVKLRVCWKTRRLTIQISFPEGRCDHVANHVSVDMDDIVEGARELSNMFDFVIDDTEGIIKFFFCKIPESYHDTDISWYGSDEWEYMFRFVSFATEYLQYWSLS